MSGERLPDFAGRAIQGEPHKARVGEHVSHASSQRAQFEIVAHGQTGRQGPVLRAGPEVPFTEDDGHRVANRSWRERSKPSQTYFDWAVRRPMLAHKARGQCGGIVRNDKIPVTKQIDESRALPMPDLAAAIDDEQLGLPRALDGQVGGDHRRTSSSSRAAVSGRFNSDGFASGTASACIGVSMSPGSIDRTRTPSAASSSLQMRLR